MAEADFLSVVSAARKLRVYPPTLRYWAFKAGVTEYSRNLKGEQALSWEQFERIKRVYEASVARRQINKNRARPSRSH